MGNLERLLTNAQAAQMARQLRPIISDMGLTMPDPLQVQLFQAELLKTHKRLVLRLSPDNQELLELRVFGEAVGFSVELRGPNNQKLVELSERLEVLLDGLTLTTTYDDVDWGEYLGGILDSWWFVHSKIWDAHGSKHITEEGIKAMFRELDSTQPTANGAAHEARNVVFGLYSTVAKIRSRMGALQLSQFTTKVMGHLYGLRVPASVNVQETIAKFVD